MALIKEDGSIVTDANTYVDVADVDAYFANLGRADWTGDNTVKEAAIHRAAQYIDNHYRKRWRGFRVNLNQSMLWPRSDVYLPEGYLDYTQIPKVLRDAQCEAALRALQGELAPDLERGGRIKSKKVDVLETVYTDSAPATTRYQVIDDLLVELVTSSNSAELLRS